MSQQDGHGEGSFNETAGEQQLEVTGRLREAKAFDSLVSYFCAKPLADGRARREPHPPALGERRSYARTTRRSPAIALFLKDGADQTAFGPYGCTVGGGGSTA